MYRILCYTCSEKTRCDWKWTRSGRISGMERLVGFLDARRNSTCDSNILRTIAILPYQSAPHSWLPADKNPDARVILEQIIWIELDIDAPRGLATRHRRSLRAEPSVIQGQIVVDTMSNYVVLVVVIVLETQKGLLWASVHSQTWIWFLQGIDF